MRKVLVTGASGLLGGNFLQILKGDWQVTGLYCHHKVNMPGVLMQQLDLLDQDAVRDLVGSFRPDLIIHCAALTDVDYCEKYPGKARQVNVDMSAALATLAQKYNSRLVHISTDAVYGKEAGHAAENDELLAVNEYAKSKIIAEQAVTQAHKEAIIIRSAIYGWNIQNKLSFAEYILKTLLNDEQATLFQDVFFSPVLVNQLIEIVMLLVEKGAYGVFNVGSSRGLSKLAFGHIVAETWGLASDNIVPTSIATKKLGAVRPLNPTMNVDKVSTFLGEVMPEGHYGLKVFRDLLDSHYVEGLKPGVQTLGQLQKVWQ